MVPSTAAQYLSVYTVYILQRPAQTAICYIKCTVYLASWMQPYCPRWPTPWEMLRLAASDFKHMQVSEQIKKLTQWLKKRKEKMFVGGIKIFSVPVLKKPYCHATKLIPSRVAIATFSTPIVFFPSTVQPKYPEDECPPQ